MEYLTMRQVASLTCTSGINSTAVLYTGKSHGAALIFFLSFPKKHIMESPFYRFWDYTVFVATAFMSNPLMVTLPSDNCGPSCWTTVFLRELVFPTWYSRSIQFCSGSGSDSVAGPKLFNFGSGSGSTFFLILAPAPFPAIYCHFKMYYNSSKIRNTVLYDF